MIQDLRDLAGYVRKVEGLEQRLARVEGDVAKLKEWSVEMGTWRDDKQAELAGIHEEQEEQGLLNKDLRKEVTDLRETVNNTVRVRQLVILAVVLFVSLLLAIIFFLS